MYLIWQTIPAPAPDVFGGGQKRKKFGEKTACHRSRDHSIAHMSLPIGGPLEPSLYL